MRDMRQTIRGLQETLIVIAEIEKRPREDSQRMVLLEDQSAGFRRRIDQNLAEITERLNRLIGYGGGMNPPPPG